MIHFIVEDPRLSVEKETLIYGWNGLLYTTCNPKMTEKVQMGLQGMSGNHVPVLSHKTWRIEARKLFFGK